MLPESNLIPLDGLLPDITLMGTLPPEPRLLPGTTLLGMRTPGPGPGCRWDPAKLIAVATENKGHCLARCK